MPPLSSRDWSYRERDVGGDDPNTLPGLLRGAAVGAHFRDTSITVGEPGWLWVLVTSAAGVATWAQIGAGAGTGEGFPLTSNVSAAGFRIADLGAPVAADDALSLGAANTRYVRRDGTTPLTNHWDVGGFRLDNLGAPVVGGDAANKTYVDAAVAITPTVPGAYPYTTLEADKFVAVNTASARSILLKDGSTYLFVIVADATDQSSANPITVSLANTAKTLNGTVAGSVAIAINGAQRGFWRDTSGAWHGGV